MRTMFFHVLYISIETIITNHNKNILGKKTSINKSHCNCRNKEACPLNGQCQIAEVVYKSTEYPFK